MTLLEGGAEGTAQYSALPFGTDVLLDGAPATLGVALPIDPGHHVVVVRAPGQPEREIALMLAERESRLVRVSEGSTAQAAPGLSPSHAASFSPTPPPPRSSDERASPTTVPGSARTILGFVGLGVGALGLGVGTFTMVQAIDASSSTAPGCDKATRECTNAASRDAAEALSSRATSYTAATVASFAVGAVGLGAGILLLATKSSTKPDINVLVGPNRVGVAGHF